jgi:hypothetical protein
MPDLEKNFEQKNLNIIARNAKKIKALYEGSIIEISLVGSTITLKEGTFLLSKYPQLKAVIDHELQKLHLGIYSTIVNSVKESWDLSNEKNDLIVDKRLAGKKPTANGERILYDPNKGALDEFIKRKEKGMNLSDRVWNSLEPFKTQLEGGLAIGISEGKSAASLARDLKSYLNDPDKLFRRVRDDNGTLQLSKAAKDFKPGRGIYRSSYKNALRLTATETNIAYNAADQERWLKMPFVIGLKIQTSHNHPEFDICDELAGVYPKTFVWRRWHPFCICFQTAVQLSDEEYEKYEDKILAGEPLPEIKGITEVPKAFTDYVEKNKDRIEGYKSKPYWYKDNKQYHEPKPVKVEAPVKSFTPAKTLDEARQFAKENMGFVNTSTTLNLEAHNLVNKRLFELKNQYKADSLKSMIDEKRNINYYASADAVTMAFNPSFFNNPEKFLAKLNADEASGWLHKGQNLTATIDHEFGHVLTTNRLMASKVVKEEMSEEIKKIRSAYMKDINKLYKQGKSAINEDFYISTYANKDIYEFTAEAFSMALNAPNPSKYALQVKEVIDKYFKR